MSSVLQIFVHKPNFDLMKSQRITNISVIHPLGTKKVFWDVLFCSKVIAAPRDMLLTWLQEQMYSALLNVKNKNFYEHREGLFLFI